MESARPSNLELLGDSRPPTIGWMKQRLAFKVSEIWRFTPARPRPRPLVVSCLFFFQPPGGLRASSVLRLGSQGALEEGKGRPEAQRAEGQAQATRCREAVGRETASPR